MKYIKKTYRQGVFFNICLSVFYLFVVSINAFGQKVLKNYTKPSEILFLDTIKIEGLFYYERTQFILTKDHKIHNINQVFVHVDKFKNKPNKSDYQTAVFVPILNDPFSFGYNYHLKLYYDWLDQNNHSDFVDIEMVENIIGDRYDLLDIFKPIQRKLCTGRVYYSELYHLKITAVKINLDKFIAFPFYKRKISCRRGQKPELIKTNIYLIINIETERSG